jgi:hypothetical protein
MYIYPGVSSRREVQVYIPKGFIEEGSPGIYIPGFHQGGKSMYVYPKVSSRREVQVNKLYTWTSLLDETPGYKYLDFPP